METVKDNIRVSHTLDLAPFDGVTIELSQLDQQLALEVVKGSKLIESYGRIFGPWVNASPGSYRTNAYRWKQKPDVALYIEYLKKKLGAQLELNTDVIVKDLALAYHTSLADFVDAEGKRKCFKDINPLALQCVKISKLEFDTDGNPVGELSFVPMNKLDVLKFLTELSEIDTELVESLKAKVVSKETNLIRQ